MDASSKRIKGTAKDRVGGFGVYAPDNENGSDERFSGHVPIKHRHTNNGAKLWAALEALQGFWVPKLVVLTDSQHLQLGANGRASTGVPKYGH